MLAGARTWIGGDEAAALDWETILDDAGDKTAIRVGPAGNAILAAEYNEHHGRPEQMAAKARRLAAFYGGR